MRLPLKDAAPIVALLALLARDRLGFAHKAADAKSPKTERDVATEYVILIDHLGGSLRAGESIELDTPRSTEAAEHDGGAETVGGYLSCLLRDEYNSVGAGEGWERLRDLSAVLVQVRPLPPTS